MSNIQQTIISSGGGLAPNRRQAIIWTNIDRKRGDLVYGKGDGNNNLQK